jgi:hypothetical protein
VALLSYSDRGRRAPLMIMSGRDARGPNMSATEWRAPSND